MSLIHPPLVVTSESRTGRHYAQNYDRYVVDERVPLFAVIDSECDDGTAGDIVSGALLDARQRLLDAIARGPNATLELLVGTLREANATIFAIPKGEAGHRGGAAVTVCSCSGRVGVVAHVGDCRIYALEQAAWVRRSTDHTLREEVRSGSCRPVDMATEDSSYQVGVVMRAVGIMDTLDVDTFRFSLDDCSSILLCTRGAWLPADPTGAGEPLPTCSDDTQIAAFLMERYEGSGERDNATIVVARLS
jgi:PPM family protein phosphatase